MTPRERDKDASWDEVTYRRRNGEVRKSTSFEQPLGRTHFDRRITDVPEPKRKRTGAEKRRYRRQQQMAQLVADQKRAGKK